MLFGIVMSLRLRGRVLLLAFATLGLSVWNLHRAYAQEPASPEPAARSDQDNHGASRRFRLKVLGPDGQPVPDAAVEIRTVPLPTADQLQRGELVRTGNYGLIAKADSHGRLELVLPQEPGRFNLKIEHPGYGPYWAQWDNIAGPQDLPSEFTAELDGAWTVGGVLIDEAGQPVADATIGMSIAFKKRPGDTSQLYVGSRVRSDAEGRWQYASVPDSMADVQLEISHPKFQPLRPQVPRSGFEVRQGEMAQTPIQMKAGLSVTGVVTDEAGQGIEGMLVRTQFLNDVREATTDATGAYRLIGCEPQTAQIVVSGKGFAIDMQEVRIEPEMPPVNFTMQPGGTVRIRVVDEQGVGIPKARIFFQRWRGAHAYFAFDHVDQYADEQGVWHWNEAPLDEFHADICRPGGMQISEQPLIARDEEYVFTPPPALVVSGRVLDKTTGQPVKRFRVTPGLRNPDSQIRMNWIPSRSYEATGGEYRMRFTHDYLAHLVQIEAEGYLAAISRDIKTSEGEVTVDFELIPAEDIAATIVTASGEPAAGARIALGVAGSQISVDKGEIDNGSTYALRIDADAQGRFRIPARTEPFRIVITHPAGAAHLDASGAPIPDPIVLTPWARAEGIFRVAGQPVPNAVLSLHGGFFSRQAGGPKIWTHHDVITGEDGRFVFERVFPGPGRVGRRILLTVDDGATEVSSAQQIGTVFVAGETTTLELGGTGQRVVGELVPPKGRVEPMPWQFALVEMRVKQTPLPRPTVPAEVANDREQLEAWWADVGQPWQAAYEIDQQRIARLPQFTATVGRDGRFQIDDMPPGDYVLRVWFSNGATATLRNHHFSVPQDDEPNAVQPMDLGQLTLESR